MSTEVTPQEFKNVEYDAAEIAALADDLAAKVGILPDSMIKISVDEMTPLGRVEVTSLDPITITAESGAFENPKKPRTFSAHGTADVLGRVLYRTRDALDDSFGDPPAESALTIAQHTAWDTYAMGRMERLGHDSQRQRRLYHFRNRHGFTDTADAAFEALWTGVDLTWADVDGHSQKALAEKPE